LLIGKVGLASNLKKKKKMTQTYYQKYVHSPKKPQNLAAAQMQNSKNLQHHPISSFSGLVTAPPAFKKNQEGV